MTLLEQMDAEISNYDVMMEATAITSYIMKEKLFPQIDAVLSTPVGDRKFKQLVGNFLDKNNSKLHTSGPAYFIIFADDDKKGFFDLFKIDPKYVKKLVKEVTAQIGSKSDFKLLSNNPIFWVFYGCIRFYHMKKDQKGLNTALAIYALSDYPSVYSTIFPHEPNLGVLQYTMDNLTGKFIMKKEKHVFGALFTSISHSYDFLSPYMTDASDAEIIRFIQRIRNDQKSMLKKIMDQYMKNHAKGLRVSLTKDSTDEVKIDDEYQNNTSVVEFTARKVMLAAVRDGVDIQRCSNCATVCQVSISNVRFYMSKIITEKYTNDIEQFIEAILFIFMYDDKHRPEDINSSMFLPWCAELFRKTNSNNENIKCIKESLDKWAEETGINAKFSRRDATKTNYKKAIFFYFAFSIQTYNKY